MRAIAIASGAAVALVGVYLALGGASYAPAAVAEPCASREDRNREGFEQVAEQIVLSALDGAACELGVSREELVLALRDEESLDAFAAEHGVDRGDAERAFEDGIDRALAEAEEAGALSGFTASLVARAVDAVPPWLLLEALESLGGLFSP
jgi:hypothetical protein